MKVIANRCFWNLAKMLESDIQRFASGPVPLGRKRGQEQCQDHTGNVSVETLERARPRARSLYE